MSRFLVFILCIFTLSPVLAKRKFQMTASRYKDKTIYTSVAQLTEDMVFIWEQDADEKEPVLINPKRIRIGVEMFYFWAQVTRFSHDRNGNCLTLMNDHQFAADQQFYNLEGELVDLSYSRAVDGCMPMDQPEDFTVAFADFLVQSRDSKITRADVERHIRSLY